MKVESIGMTVSSQIPLATRKHYPNHGKEAFVYWSLSAEIGSKLTVFYSQKKVTRVSERFNILAPTRSNDCASIQSTTSKWVSSALSSPSARMPPVLMLNFQASGHRLSEGLSCTLANQRQEQQYQQRGERKNLALREDGIAVRKERFRRKRGGRSGKMWVGLFGG